MSEGKGLLTGVEVVKIEVVEVGIEILVEVGRLKEVVERLRVVEDKSSEVVVAKIVEEELMFGIGTMVAVAVAWEFGISSKSRFWGKMLSKRFSFKRFGPPGVGIGSYQGPVPSGQRAKDLPSSKVPL